MDRIKLILMQPKQEWPVIDQEPATVAGLYTGYVIPLAAIGPIASIIGMSVFGARLPLVGSIRVPMSFVIRNAVVQYILALAGVFVVALLIDWLAPRFAGQRSQIQALKVAAYSSTAAWVAGIFNIVPALAFLGLVGALYSLYLLYLGLPVLMKTPPEKATGYTVVVILAAIVVFIAIGVIASRFIAYPAVAALG